MDYYFDLVNLTHNYVGHYVSDKLSLDSESSLYVSHGILILTTSFILLQLISIITGSGNYSPAAPSGSKRFTSLGKGSSVAGTQKRQNRPQT